MKIIKTDRLLKAAREGRYAVPAVNVDNLDSIRGVLYSCQKLESPVILQLSPIQVESRKIRYQIMIQIMQELGREFEVTAAIHLDHGIVLREVKEAVDAGFTSVMYDGSASSYQTNIQNTKEIKAYAKEIPVEGELGVIGGTEGSGSQEQTLICYTGVREAEEYVSLTGVDFLAVAVGNAHGIYREKPQLHFKRIEEIREAVPVPLVLHGASGLSETDIAKAVKSGISKINFFTDMDLAFRRGMDQIREQEPEAYSFQYLAEAGKQAGVQMEKIIRMCHSQGKA